MDKNQSAIFRKYCQDKIDAAEKAYVDKKEYYEQLKSVFEQVLKDSLKEKYQELMPQGFDQYISGQLLETIDYNEMMESLNTRLDKQISKIQSKDQSLWNDFVDAVKAEVEKTKSKNNNNFRTRDTILKAIDVKFKEKYGNQVQRFTKKASLAVAQWQNPDIRKTEDINGAYHYFKRRLIAAAVTTEMNQEFKQSLLSDEAIKGYGYLLGGYIREVLTSRLINDLATKTITSKSTVDNNPFYDLKVISSAKLFNETIGAQIKNIPQAHAIYDIEKEIKAPFLGIQSKSWQPPANLLERGKNLRQQWFEIGDRARVLQSPEFTALRSNEPDWDRGWHNSVALCAAHLEMLIGAYLLGYSLSGGFVYTSDLIQQMLDSHLYLTFYFSRGNGKGSDGSYGFEYPATSLVVLQKSLYLQKYLMSK